MGGEVVISVAAAAVIAAVVGAVITVAKVYETSLKERVTTCEKREEGTRTRADALLASYQDRDAAALAAVAEKKGA